MNLRYVEVTENKLWDELVLTFENYTFLNSSARFNYSPNSFRYAVYKSDELVGILIGFVKESHRFGKYVEFKHSPLVKGVDNDMWEDIISFCRRMGEEKGAFFVRISPLVFENETLTKTYRSNGLVLAPVHNIDALVSQHIDLSKDIESLKYDMSKTKRNLLNRLLKDDDVKIDIVKDLSQIDIFLSFYRQTTQYKGYIDKHPDELKRELEYLTESDMLYMIIGSYKGKSVGIWLCIAYGKNIHLYQAVMDISFRDRNINMSYRLYWEALSLGKQLGCLTLDLFGGVVPDPCKGKNHPWEGIGAFKESLGGKKVTYMHSRDIPIKKLKYRIFYLISLVRTRLRGYCTNW